MSVIDELVEANARYAERHDAGDLPAPPARRVAIVTCMDARLVPSEMLGLRAGDAHVIRNAGGRARDALRSLVISQRLLGTTEVMVIHHRACGMLGLAEEGVREDVGLLRASPLVAPDATIRGFLYDERTGRLEEISP